MSFDRIEKVLPAEMFEDVCKMISTVPWAYGQTGWKSNHAAFHGHWNHSFVKADGKNCLDMSGKLNGLISDVWQYIKDNYAPGADLLRCYTNSHTFGVEGYPHKDSIRAGDRTLLIYINRTWETKFGGETMLYLGDEIEHAELPSPNRGLVFDGTQLHCARGVTRICPAQRITLMFKFAPAGLDPLRQDLQSFLMDVGAQDISHSKRSLLTHLTGTYDLLRQSGQPADVCAAGGLHSIFGTNAFKKKTLDVDEIGMVTEKFGERVAYLAELFSKLARPNTLENALKNRNLSLNLSSGASVTLDLETIQQLCEIEAANLVDQRLKDWKRLPVLESMARKYQDLQH